jgi:Predicted GTPase
MHGRSIIQKTKSIIDVNPFLFCGNMESENKIKVVIMGAAGRDFHNFNVFFRDRKNADNYEVVAFTATQIPNIEDRMYPKELAGERYPDGISILPEEDLPKIIKENHVDEVILAYSDLPYNTVMDKASMVLASGADFKLMGPESTMIKSNKPVISICAVRTGSGKSQTTRKIGLELKKRGHRVVIIRHPMPYGDLKEQICQRFESYGDLDKHKCTIEEREEYEPHIDNGLIVYAGVDYGEILKNAEKEADVIVWDGGNNDLSFYKSDLVVVVADPLRAGDERSYYPGSTNLRMADVVIINKMDSANRDSIETVRKSIMEMNPKATIIDAASPLYIEDPSKVRGKRVLAIEDGPTLTHGTMEFGAAYVAAKKFGAAEIVNPIDCVSGSIKKAYEKYPQLKSGKILPALGYGKEQLKELEDTIKKVDCDIVLSGTPIDLTRVISIDKPIVRVRYELGEIGKPDIKDVIDQFEEKLK